jgi:putative sigma-54 modulation protein
MNIRVTARHYELSPEFKRYVEGKIAHLLHYFDRVHEAHVVLEQEGHRKIADVTVHAARVLVSSEQDGADMRSAFDRAVEKVERQIRRHKDRTRNRKRGVATAEVAAEAGGAAAGQIGFVPEDLASEPMTAEQALRELDGLRARFLVFLNSETRKVNVVYRRDDGDFGLVEPEG